MKVMTVSCQGNVRTMCPNMVINLSLMMRTSMTEMLAPNTRRLHGCISTGLVETRLVARLTKT